MKVRELQDRFKTFAKTRRGKRMLKIARGIFVAAIVGVLVLQISEIGWQRVLSSLPTRPLFYALVLGMYLLLPVTESMIYGRLWHVPPLKCLPIMIRKRVLNVDVIGYSGEVYLFVWARERVSQTAREIMGAIKDNLIVSSAASLSAAAILIGVSLAGGFIELDDFIEQPSPIYVALGALAVGFLAATVYRFRGIIFSIPRRLLPLLGAAHLSRFMISYVMQIAAWWIVLPSTPFQTWATLLVVFVLINRIPFLPSSDLVFVSAGAGISPMLDVPAAPVVGMLLVRSAIDRLLNLLLFTTTMWYERRDASDIPDTNVDFDDPADDAEREGQKERTVSLKT